MKTTLDPEQFFFSGGVETSIIYMGTPTIYAGKGIGADALMIIRDGLARFYVKKEGARHSKDAWLTLEPRALDQAFNQWKQRWIALEPELFDYAASADFDWRTVWNHLEDLNKKFWLESYKVENLDPFAAEMESTILLGLDSAGIPPSLLHELITPLPPTRTQLADIALQEVAANKMSVDQYIRAYWYRLGTWNGGTVLTAADVTRLLQTKNDTSDNQKHRQKIHAEVKSQLDEPTNQLLHLLRVLTLWREERKVFVQQINCCLQRVVTYAAQELKVSPQVISFSWPDEVEAMAANPHIAKERAKAGVLLVHSDSEMRHLFTGAEALKIMQPFIEAQAVEEVRGTVASSGRAQGTAHIVLSPKDFSKFHNGEVLVTTMTRPEFLPVMQQAAAIVTDEGGLTSHAAITSRELKKPCIIGTKIATQSLRDGDLVEVDANLGIVKVLKPAP